MNEILLTGVCVLIGTAPSLLAQKGIGAKYGARDPLTCASTKDPAKGAPSPEQAKQYLRCHLENVGSGANLYLLENVSVEVGKGTPFLELPKSARPFNADPDALVYPIRGSYVQYQCSVLSAMSQNAGKNCNSGAQKNATGHCFRTAFGDWTCNMSDIASMSSTNRENRNNIPFPK